MLTIILKTTTNAEHSKCNFGKARTVSSPATRQNSHRALIKIVSEEQPPRRFIAGADALGTAEEVVKTLRQQIDAYSELSSSLAYDNA